MVYGVRTLGGSKIWAALAAALLAAGAASLAITLASPGGSLAPGAVPAAGDSPQAAARAGESYGRLPMRFEANRGQTDSRVKFLNRGPGYTLFLTPREAVLSLTKRAPSSAGATPGGQAAAGKTAGAVVRMKMLGANPNPKLAGLAQLPGAANYLTGKDRRDWKTGVPSYRRVRYESVYPGTDLVYYGREGRLEYDFVVKPGADPRRIALGFAGAKRSAIDRTGALVLSTRAGAVRQRRPVLYQTVGGKRRRVAGRYVMSAHNRVGFRVGRYDRTRPLVIDPVMEYSTYLGGSGGDQSYDVAVDSSGSAYVTGLTTSTDFPTAGSPPHDTTKGGQFDVFVAKLNPQGSALAYSTYLGGSGFEFSQGIAVDAAGRAYVTGEADAPGFPTTPNAYAQSLPGPVSAFLSVLNPQGSGLDYSTYLGGSDVDSGAAVAVDSSGNAYVTGFAFSTDFPKAAGGYQDTAPGGGDVFVARINPAASGQASVTQSTYLGGASDFEQPADIALDGSGVYLTGSTFSTDFPTKAAFQAQSKGNGDAFVSKLSPTLTSLGYSTYLGGAGGDSPGAIAVDSAQHAFIAGGTGSSDFPVDDPFQSNKRAGDDGFVTRLAASGSALDYSSYLGGSGPNEALVGVAVDAAGGAYVTGVTAGDDLPALDPVAARGARGEAFVARVNPDGGGLSFLSYLGGGGEEAFGELPVAVDPAGSAYVAGSTGSVDFPTVNPLQPESAGQGRVDREDAFVLKLAPDPVGAPYVTAVAPLSGPAGTHVRITGHGFTGATAVRFGGVPATSFVVDSHNQITAVAPAHAEGPAAVTVTRPAGTSAPNPISRFHYSQGTWRPAGTPAHARPDGQTATLLRSGKVLVVGGDTAELYDPATGDWTPTGSLSSPRSGHTATLLGGPACSGGAPPAYCGKVLVEGGGAQAAELYNPASGTWNTTGAAAATRFSEETATLLPDGRVLVVGGRPTNNGTPAASAELYDSASGTWSAAANLGGLRADHTATLISGTACAGASPPAPCGKVLVVGGVRSANNSAADDLASARLYDPATNSWTDAGALGQARRGHTATLLPDGRVMVVGGRGGGVSTRSVEIYDPNSGLWTPVPPLGVARDRHVAVSLEDGRVLVAGGVTTASEQRTAEIYDPAAGRWRPAGLMSSYRTQPTLIAARLTSGDVLVTGDDRSTELYSPARAAGTGSGGGGGGGAGGGYQLPPANQSAPFADCPRLTANVIRGTAASNSIVGTPRADRIFAGTGDDTVDGLAGSDCIDLGPGTDRGQGGTGADLIVGGLGRDRIAGSSGNDRLRGGSSADRLIGGFGNDRIDGQSGADRINGERGRDRINGGSSNDRVAGDQGSDRINGNSGNDSLRGNSGRDRITGSSGRDRISAGSGRDRIDVRDGQRDRVNCGSGRDRVSADSVDLIARNCERVTRRRSRGRASVATARSRRGDPQPAVVAHLTW